MRLLNTPHTRALLFSLVLLCAALTGACSFTNPGGGEETLAAQNATLQTEVAGIRGTATVEADRMQITLEYAATIIANVAQQSTRLSATLIARGTPAVDVSGITPQAPAPTLPGAPPVDSSNPAVPQATATPTAGGPPSLSNIMTAEGVGSNDCALSSVSAFTTATQQIYVVATASNLTSQDTITSRWLQEGQEVVRFDWTPEFDIAQACIWFYIDQTDVTFTAGNWSVELDVNGTPAGTPVTFMIQ